MSRSIKDNGSKVRWRDNNWNAFTKSYTASFFRTIGAIALMVLAVTYGGTKWYQDYKNTITASMAPNTTLTFPLSKETLTTKPVLVSSDKRTMVLPLARGTNSNLTSVMKAYRVYLSYYANKAKLTRTDNRVALATNGASGDILLIIHTKQPRDLAIGAIIENTRYYNTQNNDGTDYSDVGDGEDVLLPGQTTKTADYDGSDVKAAQSSVKQAEQDSSNQQKEQQNKNYLTQLTSPDSSDKTAFGQWKSKKEGKKKKTGDKLKDTDSIYVTLNAFSKSDKTTQLPLWNGTDFNYSNLGKALYANIGKKELAKQLRDLNGLIKSDKQQIADLQVTISQDNSDEAQQKLAAAKDQLQQHTDTQDKLRNQLKQIESTSYTKADFNISDSSVDKKDAKVGNRFGFIN